MTPDFEILDAVPSRKSGHGGARDNAGRKPAGYQKSQEVLDYDKARARNEAAKAELNELEVKIKTGEYVSRAAVQQAAATALSTIAQTLRSIPDNLERKGVPVQTCALIEKIIDESMDSLASDLEMMSGGAA